MSSRHWCFTVNNPVREEDAFLQDWKDAGATYIIFQRERGDSGTEHYQGYLEFGRTIRLSGLRRVCDSAHFEIRRGTNKQAAEYCRKPTGRVSGPYEWGELSGGRGERRDLKAVKKAIDDGKSMLEIADEFFEPYCRFYRAFERYRCLRAVRDDGPRDVVVIYGPTGTGKTKYAVQFPDLYIKLDNCKWFDGYTSQKTILFDEFYGWIPYSMLLRICDRYVVQGETKGGSVPLVHDRIIFTTNQKPANWYPNMKFESFIRRVSKWIHMPILDAMHEFDTYEEFISHIE